MVGTFLIPDANADLSAQIGTFSLNQMTEGICAADSHQQIVHWSAGMERMFGVSKEDALGQLLGNLLTFIGKDQDCIEEARAGRIGRNVHEHYVRSRSTIARFQITYGILKCGDAEAGLMCFVREVGATFDKTPEVEPQERGGFRGNYSETLENLESRLRLVADAIPNLVWLSDVTGDRVLFNDKWLQFTGRTFEQESGRGWWNGMHADDARKFARIYAEAINERKGYHTQYRLRRADGQFRLLLESGVPQFSAEGIFLGMMGSCNDISETHFTQQGMQAAQRVSASFSSTLDHAPIAIWRLDRDLVIKKANKAVAIQLRMPEANLIGQRFGALVHSIPETTFDAVLERGERIQLENFPVLLDDSKDAKPVFWDVVAWPQKDNEGRVTGVCISSAEVTERQRQNQQKDDFVAALVHDLKTPLIGADRTLEQMIGGGLGNLDSGQTDVLTMLRRSNHQLLVMVQNLIEVYRYEAGHPSLAFEELDIFDLLKKCVPELQALADHRGIDLAAELPPSRPNIIGDRLAIRRVFLNLLDNALKFTGRDGTVRVTADVRDTYVLVRVTDTGIGITSDDQSKLFQRYYQGETGKRYAIGTGLGLYLCKQIVTAHKGTIAVESEEGRGTTFSITLPLAS